MSFAESALGVPLEPFLRLKTWWDERAKRKGVKEQLLNSLDIQIENYSDSFEGLGKLGENELIPLLDSIKIGPTIDQLNRFIILYTKIIDAYAIVVDSFMNLANGCKLISINPGFMGDLEEGSSFLYDFVVRMADMVREDKVVVMDDRFYMFLKLYEKEFSKDIKKKEVKQATDYMKPYVSKVKNVIAPSIARIRPRKKTSRKIVKSFDTFRKTTKLLKIEPSTIDIKEFIPKNLQPMMIILEEISEIKP